MKIVVINKDKLGNIPPLISVINILSDLGHEVVVITGGVPDSLKPIFLQKGIKWNEILFKSSGNPFKKIYQYLKFRKEAYDTLRKTQFDLLWIEGGNTIRALGVGVKKYRYILQISEMYENDKAILASIDNVIREASAVMIPEYCRAVIYKVWFKLKRIPYILMNKPDIYPNEDDCKQVLSQYSHLAERFTDKKIILYQGGISRTRMLDKIAHAINQLNSDYHLLLVGPEQEIGLIESLKKITDEITHIPFIPAPNYLAFCKIAHIGYVFYAPESLNNIFCAPNKICEYSSYGLPMLGNDIPGLKFTIGNAGAGVVVDPKKIDNIVEGIEEIEKNYDSFVANSIEFHRNVDNKKVIYNCLNNITNGEK